MNEPFDFGMLLQKLRKERGWTQEQLAAKINRESSIISRYEKNLQSPTFETVRSFASIFNVSMDYLSGMERGDFVSARGLTAEQIQLLSELSNALLTRNTSVSRIPPQAQYDLIGKLVAALIA